MQKYATVLWVLLVGLLIGGCGSGSSTTVAPATTFDVPASLADPRTTPMGGAVPGGAITGKFSNYSVSTRAGIAGSAGFTNTSTATKETFNHPTDITTDGTNFYITDYLNNAIRSMDPAGVVETLACTDAVTGAAVLFNRPTGITTDGKNLYVVDSGSNTIRIIDKSTNNKVTTIGSTAGIAGSVDTAIPSDARFNQPTGITTDGVNLYVTDTGNHTIRRIDITNAVTPNAVTTVAGAPGTAGSDNGIQGAARFNQPARITTDRTNLYVTDFTNRTIRKIVMLTGEVSTIAGKAGTVPGTDDADAAVGTDARFNQPNGITTDGLNLYVTDSFNNTIRRISLTGTFNVVKIAGVTGSPGHVDSVVGTPSFDTPIGITSDGTSLFVADSQNHTIRKIH